MYDYLPIGWILGAHGMEFMAVERAVKGKTMYLSLPLYMAEKR